MTLVSFGPAGEERPGVIDGDAIIDLNGVSRDFPDTVREILAKDLAGEIRTLLQRPEAIPATARRRMGTVRLGPAITNPSKIICLCLLYTSDAADERSSVD